MRQRLLTWMLLALLTPNLAWLEGERSRIVEGNRLLKEGKAAEAVQRYGEALLADPDSPLLHYNLGNAHYKAGQYSEALASYGRVRAGEDDPQRLARIAYNAGNVQFRLAAAMESEKPQEALKSYAQALVAYRRALGADPNDQDAKFNYELTTKRLADLQKKLEEEKKEQEQKEQEQEQQQEQQEQEQQQQEQQQDDQQQPQEEPNQSREPEEDQAQPQPQHEPGQEEAQDDSPSPDASDTDQQEAADEQAAQDAGSATEAGEPSEEEQARREAAALLDSAKSEELSPDEFVRQVQGGAVAEPAQDW